MKKLFILMAALAAVVASCNSKDELTPKGPETEEPVEELVLNDILPNGYKLICDLGLDNVSDGTRAIKSGWVDGDMIFAFFDDCTEGYLRLVNKAGSNTGWACGIEGNLEIPAADEANIHLVYVPFADAKVKATYKDGKWNINTGDVYFTSVTDLIKVEVNDQSREVRLLSIDPILLKIYPNYVQLWIDRDNLLFPEGKALDLKCNMLVRCTSVDVTIEDGGMTASPVPATEAEGLDKFNGRPLTVGDASGAVYYGIIKTDKPAKTILEVAYKNRVYCYKCKQLSVSGTQKSVKAYSISALSSTGDGVNTFTKWVVTLPGMFNVGTEGSPRYIRFSIGNLQANPVNNVHLRFADNQYDICKGQPGADPYTDAFGQNPYYPTYQSNNFVLTEDRYFDLFSWGCTGVRATPDETHNVHPLSLYSVDIDRPDPNKPDRSYYPSTIFRPDLNAYSNGASAFRYTPDDPVNPGDDWGSNIVLQYHSNTYYTLSSNEWNNLIANSTATKLVLISPSMELIPGIAVYPAKSYDFSQKIPVVVEGSRVLDLRIPQHLVAWNELEEEGMLFLPQTGVRNLNLWPAGGVQHIYPNIYYYGNSVQRQVVYTTAGPNTTTVGTLADFRSIWQNNVNDALCVYWTSSMSNGAHRQGDDVGKTHYVYNFPESIQWYSDINNVFVSFKFPFQSRAVRLAFDPE